MSYDAPTEGKERSFLEYETAIAPDLLRAELVKYREQILGQIVRNGALAQFSMRFFDKLSATEKLQLGRVQKQIQDDMAFLVWMDGKIVDLTE